MTSKLPDPIRQAVPSLIRRYADAYVLVLKINDRHVLAPRQEELVNLLGDTEKDLRSLVSLMLQPDDRDRALFQQFEGSPKSILQGCTFTIALLCRQLQLYNSSRNSYRILWDNSLVLLKKWRKYIQALTDVLKNLQYLLEYPQLLSGIREDEMTAKKHFEGFCEEHGLAGLQADECEDDDKVLTTPSALLPPDSQQSHRKDYQTGLTEGEEIGRKGVFKILKDIGVLTEGKPENRSVWLLRAIDEGSVEGVKMTIDLGADVNQPSVRKRSEKTENLPLCMAARLGHDAIVDVLLKGGADIKGRSDLGSTALLSAAAAGKTSTMRILLDHGAYIEEESTSTSENGYTPLMRAVSAGRKDAIKLLRERGAKEDVKNKAGETLLHVAVRKGDTDIIRDVTKMHLQFSDVDSNNDTALHIACKISEPEVVDLLIKESDPLLQLQNKNKETPLHVAVRETRPKIVRTLLRKHAPLYLEAEHRETPVHYAIKATVESKSIEIIQMLCHEQPPLGARDAEGKTPLHHAVVHKSLEVVKILLRAGSPLDCRDNLRRLPLHYAVASQTPDIVDALLKKNSPTEARDENGDTPLDYALKSSNVHIIEALLKKSSSRVLADGKGKMLLHRAVEERKIKLIWLLLKYRSSVEVMDEHGKTPLHHAVTSGDVTIIELLLENKASLEAKDNEGKTPLHYAVRLKNLDVVKVLLGKPSPIDSKDKSGKTPLHYAVASKKLDIVHQLLSSGAKGDIKDKAGITPLEYVVSLSEVNEQASIELLQEFLRWHKASDSFYQDFPALSKASRDGKLNLVIEICRHDSKLVNQIPGKTTRFKPALHEAIKYGRLKVVKTLCSNPVTDKNLLDLSGNSPLHQAVISGRHQMVSLLIESGADKDLCGKTSGFRPLHLAAHMQKLEMIPELLRAGADPRLRVPDHDPCRECKQVKWNVQGMNARCPLVKSLAQNWDPEVDKIADILLEAIKQRARNERVARFGKFY